MMLPWVARAEHESRIADLKATIAVQDARFDSLFEKYHALKLDGAAVPAPAPVLAPWVPDPVQLAISRKAGANQQLRTHYAQLAHRMRAGNLSDDIIVKTIEDGDDATAGGIPG